MTTNALQLKSDENTRIYGSQVYKLAIENTNYNKEGKVIIASDDEWVQETEWDDMFEKMKSNNNK